MNKMTFLDFCAGIGGFRLGLELAGFKCIGFCEKDKFAVKSYRAMFDTEGEWFEDDITKLRAEEIPYADIWCFGFPCQDYPEKNIILKFRRWKMKKHIETAFDTESFLRTSG